MNTPILRIHPMAGLARLLAAAALSMLPCAAQTVHSFNLGGQTVNGDVPVTSNPDGLQITGETGTWANLPTGDTTAPGANRSATDDGVTLTFHSVIWGGTVGDFRGNNVGTRAMRMWAGYGSLDTTWTLTGLTPNASYDMVWYNKRNPPGENRHPNCGIADFDAGNGVGASAPLDGDRDQNFSNVQADASGTISGTWFIEGGLNDITAVAGVQVVKSPSPTPLQLVITPNAVIPGSYDFEWFTPREDKVYDLLSSTDLSTPPSTWLPWNGRIDIPGTPPANTLTGVPGGDDPRRFFAILEKDPLPPALINGGFEDPVLGEGGFGLLGVPWEKINLPANGLIETWNPTAGDYPIVPGPDNVCSVYFSSVAPGVPFGVRQVIDRNYATGTDYTLTVQVGRVASSPGQAYDWPGFRVELWAGSTLLAFDEDPATTAPAPGTFILSTVNYDHTNGPAATPGAPLEIRLLSRGQDVAGNSGRGWSVDFDQVQFSANTP